MPVIATATAPLPCRRCGQTADGVVVIYGPDPSGALAPRAAQCRGPCRKTVTREVPRPRPRPRDPGEALTAKRPGRCSGCPRDVVPGDRIVEVGPGRFVHFECST